MRYIIFELGERIEIRYEIKRGQDIFSFRNLEIEVGENQGWIQNDLKCESEKMMKRVARK